MHLQDLHQLTETIDTEIAGHSFCVIAETSGNVVDFKFSNMKPGLMKTAVRGGKDAIALIRTNPILAGLATGFVMDAIKNYRKAKRYTTRLYAKTPYEKQFYTQVVKDLLSVGKYKLVKKTSFDGGVLWELRRVEH